MNKFYKLNISLVSAICLLTFPSLYSSESEAADDAVDEIVVTARKREESLLDIPESVTAIGGADIERQNIKNLEDIGLLIPSLNLSPRADGFPNVSIRGLGSFGNTQGVGFYLDDVQVFSDASSRFGDLDRIEVLKGPQGTLYGGSNIGGAIKFVSARPDSSESFKRIKAVIGEQSLGDVEISVNAPLENDWAMRIFGFTTANDGYLVNPNSARVNGGKTGNKKNIGESEESGFRVSVAGPMNDTLSAYASLRWNDYEGPNNHWIRELDKNDLKHPNTVDTTTNPRHIRDTVSAMLELTWEYDGMDVTSVTSHTDTESTRYSDLDISQEYLLDLIRPEDMKVFTQELRFTSTDDSSIQWLGGFYYSMYEEKMRSELIWWNTQAIGDNFTGPLGCAAGMDTCSGVWAGEILTLEQEQMSLRTPFELRDRDKSHLAAFANMTSTYDDWELGLGLRIDKWENESTNLDSGFSSGKKETEILPKLSLTRFRDNGSIVYFTASKGYEPGGFNMTSLTGSTGLLGFEKEEATSFEIGLKGRSEDGKTSYSLAAFSIAYDSRQVEYHVDQGEEGIVEGIINMGDSEQSGLEVDLTHRVNDFLNISFSAGTVDAEWKNGSAAGVDLSGSTPPVVPESGINFTADYLKPANNGRNLAASFQLSKTGSYEGLQAWDPVTNPSYTLVNAQIGQTSEDWEVMLNVKNLFDEDYYMDVQHFPNYYLLDGGDSIVIGTLGQPRLVTLGFTYFF
ncbi:MAG: TonB-dependent receptor [Gammaproteobacteria bacterium]|nr:MAG: TonB-dependent receptor [Gammaproteobacteria bacterium]